MDLNLDDIEDFANSSDVSDGSDQQYTPAEVIEIMEKAWANEKFAPEILPNKLEVVDLLLNQIANMENNLESISSTDFRKSVHQLEVDRLRFLISSYLRTRLEKIETYVTDILHQEEQRNNRGEHLYLSDQEIKFAKEYSKSLGNFFADLTKFYPGLPSEDWGNQLIKPNMYSFVFLKSNKDIPGVILDDGKGQGDNDEVDFNEGAQMLISYSSVSDLVKNGDIQLI